jgi:hypothetical protein
MNKLSMEERVKIGKCLVEGNSLRSAPTAKRSIRLNFSDQLKREGVIISRNRLKLSNKFCERQVGHLDKLMRELLTKVNWPM